MLRLIRNAAGHAVIDFWEALRCCGNFRAGSPQMPLEDGEGILASRASSGGVKEVPVDGLHDAVCSRLSSCADALCADFLCRRVKGSICSGCNDSHPTTTSPPAR